MPRTVVSFAAAMHLIAGTANAQPCRMSPVTEKWIQTAIDGWERSSKQFLKLPEKPFPWTLLIGTACVWHVEPDAQVHRNFETSPVRLSLGGTPLSVRAEQHARKIELPAGGTLDVSGVAFGSMYTRPDGTEAPFFVLALPEVWRLNPKAADDPRLDTIILGVFSHEIVHTRQLTAVSRRVEELKARFEVPDPLDDDVVEKRYGRDKAFAAAFEEETALLYRAATAEDVREQRALALTALEMVEKRQSRFYNGPDAVYRDLEGIFLNMEGVAVWTSYRLSKVDRRFDIGITNPAEDRARNSWVQDQGLAVMLLVDALVPAWREEMLGPGLASPWTLLKRALGR